MDRRDLTQGVHVKLESFNKRPRNTTITDCDFSLQSAVGILTRTTDLMDIFYGMYSNINTVRFDDRFKLRLRAYFFQNCCHYMIIIYSVIKLGLTSNLLIPHVPKQCRK